MRNDVRLEGWKISAAGAGDDRFLESVFFTGSGVLGARGYPALRPEPRPLDTGIFAAGMFDTISENTSLTDFVNLPTPIFSRSGTAAPHWPPARPYGASWTSSAGCWALNTP